MSNSANQSCCVNRRPKPVVLCVLDGWGVREDAKTPASDDATAVANIPVYRKIWGSCPHALLDASESHVGLPKGQIGNSEVGHMNLGAGRVVFQDLPLIDNAIASGELAANPSLRRFIETMRKSGGTCHLMGLASRGGVHSHQDHMIALARAIAQEGIGVDIHAFLDGRDVPPQSAADCIASLVDDVSEIQGARIATLCGRYYAMDRDKRWDRVEKAYDLLTQARGAKALDAVAAIQSSYAEEVYDEFVLPIAMGGYGGMKDGDGILFANFRTDRAREILTALLAPDFDGFERDKTISFSAAAGMVEYSDALNPYMSALFPPKSIDKGFGEIVAANGLKQLRIAETEKYPHVTFFFNGGREAPFDGEKRILVPSPKVATYDLQPEMSAPQVTDEVVKAIESGEFDVIVLNYANPDMVGHTGDLVSAVKALEAVDKCLERLFAAVERAGGAVLLTADHGNCEKMNDAQTGGSHTAHTINRVPVALFGVPCCASLKDGKLSDVAPTLLDMLGLAQPPEMTGSSLIVRK